MKKKSTTNAKQTLHVRLRKKISPMLVALVTLGVLVSWFLISRFALWVNPPNAKLPPPLVIPTDVASSTGSGTADISGGLCPSGTDTENETLTYSIPTPWVITKEPVRIYDCLNAIRHTLQQDDYRITIGPSASGRAICTPKPGMSIRAFSNGLVSGSTSSPALRLTPEDVLQRRATVDNLYTKTDTKMTLVVASRLSPDTQAYDCTTPVGSIIYEIPIPWENSILAQMDTIVESLREEVSSGY
jgi:hypothetical protein